MPESDPKQASAAAHGYSIEEIEDPAARTVVGGIEEIARHSDWSADARPPETRQNLVGECLDARHPTLKGRVLVKWVTVDGEELQRWLPTLQNLPVRAEDRLLLVNPGNWDELVVTGVIDGFARRPEIDRRTAGHLELERDEAIRVTGRDGQELLELFQTDDGPVVRVLNSNTAVELPGKLRLAADSIELEAGAGPIKIKASDDVIVNGEMIRLN